MNLSVKQSINVKSTAITVNASGTTRAASTMTYVQLEWQRRTSYRKLQLIYPTGQKEEESRFSRYVTSDLGYTTGREVESSINGEIIHGMNATVNGVHDIHGKKAPKRRYSEKRRQ